MHAKNDILDGLYTDPNRGVSRHRQCTLCGRPHQYCATLCRQLAVCPLRRNSRQVTCQTFLFFNQWRHSLSPALLGLAQPSHAKGSEADMPKLVWLWLSKWDAATRQSCCSLCTPRASRLTCRSWRSRVLLCGTRLTCQEWPPGRPPRLPGA